MGAALPSTRPAPAAPAAAPLRRPLRIAHRGASARAPENTLAAFAEAVRLGANAIELDVHLTADGVPVVIHDGTVDRTTNGRGEVAAMTLKDLRRLDAGAWFSSRFRGERIPTLEESLEFARGRCAMNVEIKEPPARKRTAHGAAAAAPDAVARAVALAVMRTRFNDFL